MLRSRSANLIQRIESAALAAASERCSHHLPRLTELRRTKIVDRASEIGVVEHVEKIGSRLKGKPLPNFEVPPQRQIDLRSAGSTQGISPQISLHRPGRYRERRWIDFPSAGYVRI